MDKDPEATLLQKLQQSLACRHDLVLIDPAVRFVPWVGERHTKSMESGSNTRLNVDDTQLLWRHILAQARQQGLGSLLNMPSEAVGKLDGQADEVAWVGDMGLLVVW